MKMVDRYNVTGFFVEVIKGEKGDFVKYEDYERLKSKYEKLDKKYDRLKELYAEVIKNI
jgi:hypothetical protein